MGFAKERHEPFLLRTRLLKETKYVYFLLLIGYSLWIITHYKAGIFDKALQDPFFWISAPLYLYVFWALRKIVEMFRHLLTQYPKTSEIGTIFTNTVENFVFSTRMRLLEFIVPALVLLLLIIYFYSKGALGTLYGIYSPPWSIVGHISWFIFYIVILGSIFCSLILIIFSIVKGIKKLEEEKTNIVKRMLQTDKFSLKTLKQKLKPISDFVSTVATYISIYVILWNVGIFYVNLEIIKEFGLDYYFLGGFGILFVIIVFLTSQYSLYQVMREAKWQILTHYSEIYDEKVEEYFKCLNNGDNGKENIKQGLRRDLTTIRNIITDLENYSILPFEWSMFYKLLLLNSSSFIVPILEKSLRIVFKI